MAKRTVSNVLTRPGGKPEVGRRVSIRLNAASFIDGGTAERMRPVYAITDDTGLWSAELDVNADLDPDGTWYTVAEDRGLIWAFTVPAGSGDLWLRDVLVEDPLNPGPVVAGVRTVNGEGPDADGNVTVSGGGGVSNVGLDPDGVPYFEVGASGANIATDTDGVPYFEAA